MTSEDNTKKPVKIDKWDGAAVKNALDDGVRKVFAEDLDFVERFYLCDIRLGLCTVAVFTALYALLWDWLHPFPASKTVLASCAFSYFFVTVIATLYVQFVEKGIFFVGYTRDLTKKFNDCQAVRLDVNVWSTPKRYDDEYTLSIQMTGSLEFAAGSNKPPKTSSVTKAAVCSFTDFIDSNGVVLVETALKKKVMTLFDSNKDEVMANLQGTGKKDK